MDWSIDATALTQIALAVLYGGAIGLERELRGRPAGLRTMILVCLGSTLLVIAAARLPVAPGSLDPAITRVDPGRIAAGIVTGIGFLGAAVVIRLGDLIRGVTTAAAIWFTAALGIVIGSAEYGLASAATVTALMVLGLFNQLERRVSPPTYRILTAHVGGREPDQFEDPVRKVLDQHDTRVMEIRSSVDVEQDESTLCLHVRTTDGFRSSKIVTELARIHGVRRVVWD